MEKFGKDFKEHATKTIYEKKKLIPLSYEKMVFIKSKNFAAYAEKDLILMMKIKYKKTSEIIVIILENIAVYSICNLRYKTPKEMMEKFHNDSTSDYQVIIKELAVKIETKI